MLFEATKLAQAFVIDLEPQADERGFFARLLRARVRSARPTDALSPVQPLAEPTGRAPSGACTIRRRRTASRSSCAAPRERSTTSSSTCESGRRAPPVGRRRAIGRERAGPLRSRGVRPRVRHARPTTSTSSTTWARSFSPTSRAAFAGQSRDSTSSGLDTDGHLGEGRDVSRLRPERLRWLTEREARHERPATWGWRCTRSWRSSIPFAGASRETACDRRSRSSRGTCPLAVHEVPSGTPVLDWTVPKEWNIRDAWIADASGARRRLSLRTCTSSATACRCERGCRSRSCARTSTRCPIARTSFPYRTSYYEESWGFCLTQRQLDAMPDGEYDVCIDSTLEPGSLTYGEVVLAGRDRGRDPRLDARLPSVAVRRQPDRHRGFRLAGSRSRRPPEAALHDALPLRARHDRRHHLAGQNRERATASGTG